MSANESIEGFTGVARLFPLPNFVLMPHVVKPLHVFEPRYREMTRDALAGDRLVALVLLKPDWESNYEGAPELHNMACLARIINDQELPDGRLNILVRGECRMRLDEEVPSDKLYRMARGVLVPDDDQRGETELRSMMEDAVGSWLEPGGPHVDQIKKLFNGGMSLGALCDVMTFAMPIRTEVKQALLEELDVEERVRLLARELENSTPPPADELPMPTPRRRWPPDFSAN